MLWKRNLKLINVGVFRVSMSFDTPCSKLNVYMNYSGLIPATCLVNRGQQMNINIDKQHCSL